MLREIWGGFVMALRRWPTLLALAGMIAVACVVLSIALGDVLSQRAAIRGVGQFSERHVTTFTPYYPHGVGEITVCDDTVRFLVEMIDRQEAYTAIVNNMGLDDPNFAGGHETLVLFGDAVLDMFPDLKPGEPVPKPFAMRGAELADQNIDSLNFVGEAIPVVKTLTAGIAFFDANFGVIPLDRRIIIHAPAEILPSLTLTEQDEALNRAVLFAPADEVVDAYVSGNAQGGLLLVPQDAAIDLPLRFDEFLMVSAMYIVGMLAFLALALTAFVSSARSTIRQEMRTFKIREMYGATTMHISFRIGSFLATVALVPPVALLSLLLVMGGPYATAALWVMSAIVFNFIFLWFTSVRRVIAQDQIR